jgi:hypothetical protein
MIPRGRLHVKQLLSQDLLNASLEISLAFEVQFAAMLWRCRYNEQEGVIAAFADGHSKQASEYEKIRDAVSFGVPNEHVSISMSEV